MSVTIQLPRAAEEIIEKLNSHGFEAYVVGGCVRDALLGREPGDWDITTSARPQQVKAIFGRTIDTGIKHGTVTIMRGKTGYEVTTYRVDGEYEDGRHPKSVEFTSNLVEDLKRRDFTMNAMAYNHETGLVDVFGGQQDMAARLIRCVGRAEERFTEDALRILRALRFAAQLGFEIEAETEAAIRKLAPNLRLVSKERIQMELTKLLLSQHPDQIRRVFDCGASAYVSETFAKIDPGKIATGEAVIGALPAQKSLRWAAFLRHQEAGQAKRILRELKLDNATIDRVGLLVEWWKKPVGRTQAELRRTMSRMSASLYDDLICLKSEILRYYARRLSESAVCRPAEGASGQVACQPLKDASSQVVCQSSGTVARQTLSQSETPEYDRIPETAEDIRRILADTEEIRGRGDCISLKTLAVTGRDLIEAGVEPGREVGEILAGLLELVITEPERNTKEELLGVVLGRKGEVPDAGM